jgi:hypothetical protein
MLEEDFGRRILVIQVLSIRKIYRKPPTTELYNNKKLINT